MVVEEFNSEAINDAIPSYSTLSIFLIPLFYSFRCIEELSIVRKSFSEWIGRFSRTFNLLFSTLL